MTLTLVPILERDEVAFRFVRDRLVQGKAVGAFPRDRAPADGDDTAIVAWNIDEPVGFVTLFLATENKAWIDLVWVDEPFRRRGLATQMVEMAFAYASQHVSTVEFGTLLGNEPMRRLATKLGYIETSVTYRRTR